MSHLLQVPLNIVTVAVKFQPKFGGDIQTIVQVQVTHIGP